MELVTDKCYIAINEEDDALASTQFTEYVFNEGDSKLGIRVTSVLPCHSSCHCLEEVIKPLSTRF